jgi:ribA/ribD-fused uncharacterized protein
MAAEIRFYSTTGPHGYMSNFSRHPVTVDGVVYPTSEHYYQAMKTNDPEIRERIRRAATPTIAAAMGRRHDIGLRADWEEVKENVMMCALRAKFDQHPAIAARLVATHPSTLTEHTTKDRYWADGGDGTGRNRLGVLLMQLRDHLRDADAPER